MDQKLTSGPLTPLEPEFILQPGSRAPDFDLMSSSHSSVQLRDYLGQSLLLVFYSADWSMASSRILGCMNRFLSHFNRYNTAVLGISVDSVESHIAFARENQIQFPLLSDFEPKGEVARSFQVYNDVDGVSKYALFLINREGIVRWSEILPADKNPDLDSPNSGLSDLKEVLRILEKEMIL